MGDLKLQHMEELKQLNGSELLTHEDDKTGHHETFHLVAEMLVVILLAMVHHTCFWIINVSDCNSIVAPSFTI